MSVVALVPAAGRGERLGLGVAKAFVPVGDRPLLWHAVCGVLAAGCVDVVVVAAPEPDLDRAADVLTPFGGAVVVVAGGSDRIESVRLALYRADAMLAAVEAVLVHDAARALAPPGVFTAVVAAVRAGRDAVVPVLPLVDTVKQVDASGRVSATVDRTTLRSVQTPQGFAPDVLRRAHAAALTAAVAAAGGAPRAARARAAGDGVALPAVTDDAGLVEAIGEPVYTVPGHPAAFKITTEFDLALAEMLLARAHAGGGQLR